MYPDYDSARRVAQAQANARKAPMVVVPHDGAYQIAPFRASDAAFYQLSGVLDQMGMVLPEKWWQRWLRTFTDRLP